MSLARNVDVGSYLKASYPMNMHILEIMNYTGKSGNSRFYLAARARQEGEYLALTCLQTPRGLVPGPGTFPCAQGMQRKVRGRGQEECQGNSHKPGCICKGAQESYSSINTR